MRAIVVRSGGLVVGRVDTTRCAWCTDEEVCSVCHAKANALRAAVPAPLASALAHVEAHGALPPLLRGIGGAS